MLVVHNEKVYRQADVTLTAQDIPPDMLEEVLYALGADEEPDLGAALEDVEELRSTGKVTLSEQDLAEFEDVFVGFMELVRDGYLDEPVGSPLYKQVEQALSAVKHAGKPAEPQVYEVWLYDMDHPNDMQYELQLATEIASGLGGHIDSYGSRGGDWRIGGQAYIDVILPDQQSYDAFEQAWNEAY